MTFLFLRPNHAAAPTAADAATEMPILAMLFPFLGSSVFFLSPFFLSVFFSVSLRSPLFMSTDLVSV